VSRSGPAVGWLLTALAATAAAVEPPVVSWRDADAHVGEIVTVEGPVARVIAANDTWTLEFAPDDPRAFRAVVLVTLLGRAPADPVRAYTGRSVRVTGRVQRFQRRPEMVLRAAGQVALVDDLPDRAMSRTEDAPPAPPAVMPPRVPDAAEPPPRAAATAVPGTPRPPAPGTGTPPGGPPTTVAPRGLVEAVERRVAAARACDLARARWREAAAVAGERADAFARCLAAEGYECRGSSAALRPALDALDAAEAQAAGACP
jgi:hypothetical protein